MKNRRKQRQKRTHAPKWAFLVALVAICFVGYWGVQGTLRVVNSWTENLPSVEEYFKTFNYAQKSTMYAADGKTVLAEFQLENREPLESLDQVCDYVKQGTVATEDNRFYEHNGVDLMGIARALINNVTGGELEGASTITQQLVRNTILSDEATDISIERKIREAQIALDMEKMYSKDEILLMYLNTINYGDGCYGIEAAAQHYFQKHAKDLSIVQAATLVGIPQSPTYLNPVANPDACKTRRNTVLDRMLSYGTIDQEQHDKAQAKSLKLKVAPDKSMQGIYKYPYFASYVRDWLMTNYTTAEIFEGGWQIVTTLDVKMQKKAEESCKEQNASMDSALESALVAIDPETGFVKAMVGGRSFKKEQFNIAAQKGRPVGSSFKLFTLLTALEQGISPNTPMDCTSPMTLEESGTQIENFDNINYHVKTIAQMTAVSANTGFVRLQQEVGGDNVLEMAGRLGVSTDNMQPVPALTLGYADVTPLQMAAAYATVASGGIYHAPVGIQKISDKKGQVIYEPDTEGKRVLEPEIAGAATKVLQQVFTGGECTAADAQLAYGRPVAGKTGTSNEFRDHWLCGFTPQLCSAVWIGDRYNNVTSEAINANWLFKHFMDAALEGADVIPFPEVADPEYTNPFNEKQKELAVDDEDEKKKKDKDKDKDKDGDKDDDKDSDKDADKKDDDKSDDKDADKKDDNADKKDDGNKSDESDKKPGQSEKEDSGGDKNTENSGNKSEEKAESGSSEKAPSSDKKKA